MSGTTAWRVLVFATGQAIFWLCLFAAVGALTSSQDGSGRETSTIVGAIALAAVLLPVGIGGLFLGRLGGRFATGVSTLLYSGMALAGGLALLPVALALSQFEPGAFDPERASLAAAGGAAIALAAAPLLGWLGWRWSSAGDGRDRLRGLLRSGAVGCGSMLALLGALIALGVVALAIDLRRGSGEVAGLAVSAGSAAVLAACGALLTYHGVNALMGARTGRARTAPALVWLGLWLLSIVVGQELLAEEALLATLFPPLHVIASFGAGLTLIALVARQGRTGDAIDGRPTWRALMLLWAWGAGIATTIAGFLNAISGGLISLAVLAQAEAFRGVSDGEQFTDVLENADRYLSEQQLLVAALLLFSVSPPLVEETLKGAGVRLLGWRSFSRYQAFVLGVASGAGFGTLEAVLYGASALEQARERWWELMLLRGGATSMHALATGLFAAGIVRVWRAQPLVTVGCIAGAMLMHGAWNGLSVLATADVLPLLEDLSDEAIESGLSVVLGGWSLVNVAVLFLAARLLWREQAAEAQPGHEGAVSPVALTEPDLAAPPAAGVPLTAWQRPPKTPQD